MSGVRSRLLLRFAKLFGVSLCLLVVVFHCFSSPGGERLGRHSRLRQSFNSHTKVGWCIIGIGRFLRAVKSRVKGRRRISDGRERTATSGRGNGNDEVRGGVLVDEAPPNHLAVLFLTKSAPTNVLKRNHLRRLWVSRCNENRQLPSNPERHEADSTALKAHRPAVLNLSCVFVVGRSEDKALENQVQEEMAEFADLLRAPMLDRYDSLTHKVHWALAWSVHNPYGEFSYVMITDDDVYVALRNTLDWIMASLPSGCVYSGHEHFDQHVLCCELHAGHPNCVRCRNLDRRVSHDHVLYTAFASGFAYLLSRPAVLALLAEFNSTDATDGSIPGNIEDVVVASLLHNKGVELRDEPGFVHYFDERRGCRPGDPPLLAMGNAPPVVLDHLAKNELRGIPLCNRLPVLARRGHIAGYR